MENLLSTIEASVQETSKAVASLNSTFDEEVPQLISDISQQHNTKIEGVSLLTLKNHALLSYLESSVLVVLSKLEELQGQSVKEERNEAIRNTIIQRLCLEKGVKPLEKKLNYQLDKMMRAYKRMEGEMENVEKNVSKKQTGDDDDDDDSAEDDDDNESDDENLNFKPDVQALAQRLPKSKATSTNESASAASGAYKPPKIAAIAPTEIKNAKGAHNQKLQSMEEYLQENSDLPSVEASIGSTIVNRGKGGVKTAKEKAREREIQNYEESNFTRLHSTTTKKSFREKQHEMANSFAGEDWSMFNNNRNVKDGTSRKRKPTSAWDRAKKRKQ